VLFSICLLAAPFAALGAAPTGLPDFTELVEKQGSAVVNIAVTQKSKFAGGIAGLSEDDPFYEFFKRFGIPGPGGPNPHGRERQFETQSVGSGFIFSNDGYVITNAHVVDEADEVKVTLTDKREFKAKVVGADKRTDVALLKIEAGNNLPKVTIGDSGKLKVGEWVVAIGQPFGLSNSVTAGIVSALGRDLPTDSSRLVGFIQTDAAINPGNSGGPLYNMRGEVVGINSMIFSRTGGYMGLAFAVPINDAMHVVEELRTTGKIRYGRIGVAVQEVSRELADAFGLPKATGALVTDVVKGGPAEKAGVESGDVILKFDGKTVNSSGELPRIVSAVKPGTKAAVQVWRKGANKDLTITVEEWKDDSGAKPKKGAGKPKAAPNRLGLVLRELTEEEKKELKVKNGLVIEDIRSGGDNLETGDVILEIRSKGQVIEVKTPDQFNAFLAKMEKNSSVTLLVRRGDAQLFITVKVNGE
jgi:serine protease Do